MQRNLSGFAVKSRLAHRASDHDVALALWYAEIVGALWAGKIFVRTHVAQL